MSSKVQEADGSTAAQGVRGDPGTGSRGTTIGNKTEETKGIVDVKQG